MTTNNSSYTHGYHSLVLRSHNNRTVKNSADYLLATLSAGKHLFDIGSDEWMAWYQQAARANGGEPNAERHLLSWAQQAGLTDITSTSSTWCLSTPEARHWWGNMWADRILESKIARQLLEQNIVLRNDLERISKAWRH